MLLENDLRGKLPTSSSVQEPENVLLANSYCFADAVADRHG